MMLLMSCSVVTTGLICNLFMIKNLSVSVLISCQEYHEESRMRKRLRKITVAYLLFYSVVYIIMLVLQTTIRSNTEA